MCKIYVLFWVPIGKFYTLPNVYTTGGCAGCNKYQACNDDNLCPSHIYSDNLCPRHIYSDNVAQTGFLASLAGAYIVLLLALPTFPLFWSPHTQVSTSSWGQPYILLNSSTTSLKIPQVLPAFFNKIGCAVIFCHGGVLKGEITSPIYLSPTQAVQGDNPIVKK